MPEQEHQATEADPVEKPRAWVALVLGAVIFVMVVAAFLWMMFNPPDGQNAQTMGVVRWLASIGSGVAGGIFGWSIRVKGTLFSRVAATATGGGALFVVTLLGFYYGLPDTGPSTFRFEPTVQDGSVVVEVAIPRDAPGSCRTLFLPGAGDCAFTGAHREIGGRACARMDVSPVRDVRPDLRSRTLLVQFVPEGGGCGWSERFEVKCDQSGSLEADSEPMATANCIGAG